MMAGYHSFLEEERPEDADDFNPTAPYAAVPGNIMPSNGSAPQPYYNTPAQLQYGSNQTVHNNYQQSSVMYATDPMLAQMTDPNGNPYPYSYVMSEQATHWPPNHANSSSYHSQPVAHIQQQQYWAPPNQLSYRQMANEEMDFMSEAQNAPEMGAEVTLSTSAQEYSVGMAQNEEFTPELNSMNSADIQRRRMRKQEMPSSKVLSRPLQMAGGNSIAKISTARRKEEPPVVEKEASIRARETAIKRISTPEGWQQMNAWLKSTQIAQNDEQLRTLLSHCLQADVTVEMLKSNDTAKTVRKLRKSAKAGIAKMANDLMDKWTKIINEQKDESPKAEVKNNETEEKKIPKIAAPVPRDSPGVLDKIMGPAVTPSTSRITATKKDRPKTARAKISKPRLTGLEGVEDETTSTTAPPVKRRQLPGNIVISGSGQKSPTAANAAGGVALASPSATTKAPPTAVESKMPKAGQKARSVMLSDSFMDALSGPSEAPVSKKPKISRKKANQQGSTTMAGAISPTSTASPGLFADTSRMSRDDSRDESMEAEDVTVPFMVPPGSRRVRFADDNGRELVSIRYFEIEEGERVNVMKVSPEDMKHVEMKRERLQMEKKTDGTESFHSRPMGMPSFVPSNAVPWRLIPVEHTPVMAEPGVNSETRKTELERQKRVMEAFYDPFTQLQVMEPDEPMAAPSNEPVRLIPLHPTADEPQTVPVNLAPLPPLPGSMSTDFQKMPTSTGEVGKTRIAESLLPSTSLAASKSPMEDPLASVANFFAPDALTKNTEITGTGSDMDVRIPDLQSIMNRIKTGNIDLSQILSKVSSASANKPNVEDTPQAVQTPNAPPTAGPQIAQAPPTSPGMPPNFSQPPPGFGVPPPFTGGPGPTVRIGFPAGPPPQGGIPNQGMRPNMPVRFGRPPPHHQGPPGGGGLPPPQGHPPPGGFRPSFASSGPRPPPMQSDIQVINGLDLHSGPSAGFNAGPPSEFGPNDYIPPNERAPMKQCMFYQNGGCHFGDKCRFAHGDEMTIGVRAAAANPRGRGSFRGGFRGRGGPGPGFPGRGGGFAGPNGPPGRFEHPPAGFDNRRERGRKFEHSQRGYYERDREKERRRSRSRSRERRRRSKSRSSSASPGRSRRSRSRSSSRSRSRSPDRRSHRRRRDRTRSRSRSPDRRSRRTSRDDDRRSSTSRSSRSRRSHSRSRSPQAKRRSRTRSRSPDTTSDDIVVKEKPEEESSTEQSQSSISVSEEKPKDMTMGEPLEEIAAMTVTNNLPPEEGTPSELPSNEHQQDSTLLL